jgi:transcriptional regulator with GAF, ATPase, and Fis domain
VLISGESGTGKEMFARYIHRQSPRFEKPFVAVNCAALPEHLLESELFGHEKGAFTGAVHRKPGKFELAHTGTILLDEISEMDLALQAKLLRVLQEGELDRVGGTETVRIDVRVLATTNCDLEARVAEGSFRQDLYFRLNVIPLRLPPLRERGEDVIRLAQHFIDRFSAEASISGLELSRDAAEWLRGHDWAGNVRELQNLMERAVLLAGRGPIRTNHFLLDGELSDLDLDDAASEHACQEPPEASPEQGAAHSSGAAEPDLVPLEEMERRLILRSLDHTQGNRTQAAKLLGISVRTLRNKLNEYREQGVHA